MAKWLTPRTADLEVRGSSLACCVVSLDKELYFTLFLFTQVYKCRIVHKSRQLAKFASFSARFCRLLSLLRESRYGKEMTFIRSKLRLNRNTNLHCLSFLKKYKRFLTQGQFRNVMFETVFLNKS